MAAFGSTRRAGVRCEDDANLRALVEAETPVVTLVGKSSTLHVERVLETTRDENLRMIARQRRLPQAARPRGRSTTPSTSSTGSGSTRRTRSTTLARRRRRRRRLDRAVRHQRRRAARRRRRARVAACASVRHAARHPPAQRRGARAWPTRSPRCGPAASRCRARSTATASAAATSISSRSSRPSSSSWATRVLPDERAAPAHRGVALRRRGRQPAPRSARALRRPQRLRPQGRHPRRRRREAAGELPARRSGGWSATRRGWW